MPNDRAFFLVAIDRNVRDPELHLTTGLADRLFSDDYAVADVTASVVDYGDRIEIVETSVRLG